MPDSLGFGSRQRPEHPRPASTRLPNNRQHAARAAPSLHPTRFLPNKSPPSIPRPPHSQVALFPTPQLPTPRPGAPGNSQPAIRPLRQFPTTPRPCVYKPRPKHAQAPTSPSPALRASGNPPSAQQSSEHPAILRVPSSLPSTRQSSERAPSFPRQTLARIAAPTHPPPKSRTPPGIPKSPNSSRHPYTPIHSPDIPKHKKRSRHCAGSAPNYLQVSTRSYLSRSESGSGSCSSPYC